MEALTLTLMFSCLYESLIWTFIFVEVSEHNLIEFSEGVSEYNVYNTNQFQTTFAEGGRGVKSISRGDCE
jgi:hypothetical protein